MFFRNLHTPRDVHRLHEITRVLVRHGLGDLLQRAGVAEFLHRAGRRLHLADDTPAAQPLTTAERVRSALEELGPTFVKLGQVAAGRNDLLPPEWTRALAELHEHVTPEPPDAVLAQLTQDLGAPPEEVFEMFEPQPFACGSIAQVHAAQLADGTEVVLKVRRPGIEERVHADLAWLARIAGWIEEHDPDLARYRPRALARQLARSLRGELDLREEARNLERLRRELAGEPEVVLPRVHPAFTGERLLVMDRLRGPSLGAWLRSEDFDSALGVHLAGVGANAILHLVLRVGFFHADPHPGNVILLEDGRLGLLDAGMVGTLSESRRLEVLELCAAAADGNTGRAVEVLAGWSAGIEIDPAPLEADTRAFLARYRDQSLADLDLAAILFDVQDVLRQNDLILPEDVAQLIKVFATLDGLGRVLDPDFVMARHAEPYLRETLAEARSVRAMLARGLGSTRSMLGALPGDLAQLRRILRRGKVPVEVGIGDLDLMSKALARSTNRLTLGLVTAALIVGTAIALDASGPQTLGLNAFALLGFVSSTALGLALLISLRR